MKKTIRSFFSLAILVSVFFFVSIKPVFASENDSTAYAIETDNLLGSSTFNGETAVNSKKWSTIASSTSGLNCNIRVSSLATEITYISIRMLDKSGKTVWYEKNSFGSQGARIYKCGKNVYIVQAKYVSGEGTIYCRRSN